MNFSYLNNLLSSALLLASFLVFVGSAGASNITWATWTSDTAGSPGSASGSLLLTSAIGISYGGQTNGLLTAYPSWASVPSYAGGTVSNAPPANNNSISLQGGTADVNTVSFSSPVLNPVLAIWSLGNPGGAATFEFTNSEPFTLQSGGANAEYGGSSITVSGTTVSGLEGNGTIQFIGIYSHLSWTNPVSENFYAFTVGVPAQTPEPAEITLVSSGLLAMAVMLRRLRVR